jgi:ABC-type lipoprotein release transport system permease subunit
MNRRTLVRRGLWFYRRTHAGVVAGVAVSAAVLVGALGVGDSVRASLRRIAEARLGRVAFALDTGTRMFGDDLADRLGRGAPVLHLKGMAIPETAGAPQVNRIEIYGVDERFWRLAPSPASLKLQPGEVALNERLAAAVGARVGDKVALRIFAPGLLPRDAPLASRKDRDTRRGLFTVRAVLTDATLGRFSLKSDQAAPYNALVGLPALQRIMEMEGRANLLLTDADAPLGQAWRLEDAGLRLTERGGILQLESPRIYLDPPMAARALGPGAVGSLSYLVNAIASERGASTPYSFMTALESSADPRLSPVPPGMKDDEILINRWLADRLELRSGDRVTVAYSEFTDADTFVERARSFVVRDVLEMDALAAERERVPEFPGLTDVERCADWDVGLPMDEAKLKDADNEAYWKQYRQTPKAIVTLAAGRAMWANRYGDLMAVRFALGGVTAESLRARLDPADAGLRFRPVGAEAALAVAQSEDLGQLFLGMSFVLIAASLLLTAMLFRFSAEQRGRELGTLLACGFTAGQARRLLVREGVALVAVGALAGAPLGVSFARLLMEGLQGAWRGAVAGTPMEFSIAVEHLCIGAFAAAVVSILAMSLTLRGLARRPVRELLQEDLSSPPPGPSPGGRLRVLVLVGAFGGAAAIVALALVSDTQAFFAAGALALIGGIVGVRAHLARLSRDTSAHLSVARLGVRSAARRPGRSTTAAAMLACGCFIVFAVSSMTQDLSPGTLGFNLYAESSVPILRPLVDAKGPRVVPIKLREGDDASCLNLNRAGTPPILGVDPAGLDAFAALGRPEPDGAVPALVGDSDTMVWRLKRGVGDLLETSDEHGRAVRLRLIGTLPMRLSVFQGRLLIANRDFTRLFPSEAGHRVFLIDAPAAGVARDLVKQHEAAGLDVVASMNRLKEFHEVESAYLSMFLVLGGLGLILGSAGMGVLVLRSVMERRGELALLRAVGYSPPQVRDVVAAEHGTVLWAGLAVGTLAAAVALVPALRQPAAHLPVGLLGLFLAGTAALGLVWIRLAAHWALRGPFLSALRHE